PPKDCQVMKATHHLPRTLSWLISASREYHVLPHRLTDPDRITGRGRLKPKGSKVVRYHSCTPLSAGLLLLGAMSFPALAQPCGPLQIQPGAGVITVTWPAGSCRLQTAGQPE